MLSRFAKQWSSVSSRGGAMLVSVRGLKPRSKRQFILPPKFVKPRLAVQKPVIEEWDIHSEDEKEGDFIPTRKCKSKLKKVGRWSVHMARILATFSTVNLKNAIRWGCLPDECYEAVKAIQKMEATGVLIGKRRYYHFLAGLLRNAEPAVVQYILHSLENEPPAIKRIGGIRSAEMEKFTLSLAERWFTGLMNGDGDVYREVHSIEYERLDKQELKWLIDLVRGREYTRDKLKKEMKRVRPKGEVEVDFILRYKEKVFLRETVESADVAATRLRNFLLDMARRDYCAKAFAKHQHEEEQSGICKPFIIDWK